MTWKSGPPSMFAAPISWRTYLRPCVSSAVSSWENVYVWSGKCPQKMIACDHRLRTTLAAASAVSVAREGSLNAVAGAAGVRGGRVGLLERGARVEARLRAAREPVAQAPALLARRMDGGAH